MTRQQSCTSTFQSHGVDPVSRPVPRRPGEHRLQAVGQEHQARPKEPKGGRGPL